MLEKEQIQRWKCPHKDEWENVWQTPAIFKKTVMVMAKICKYEGQEEVWKKVWKVWTSERT